MMLVLEGPTYQCNPSPCRLLLEDFALPLFNETDDSAILPRYNFPYLSSASRPWIAAGEAGKAIQEGGRSE